MNTNNTTINETEVKDCHKKPFVLHIITRASWGGAQRYVYDMATDSSSFIQAVATESSGTLVDELHEAGVTVYNLSYARRSALLPFHDIRTLIDIVKLLRRVKPDIVHLHSSKMGFIGGIACRIACIPRIIFTSHGWPYNENRPLPILIMFKLLSLVIILCSHKIIAVSKAVLNSRPYGLFRKKITHIYLAIHQPVYKDHTRARDIVLRKTRFSNCEKCFFIGIVGELTKNKGHETLIRAFQIISKKHENVRLICIGNGNLFPQLHRLSMNLNIDHSIAWIKNFKDAAIFMKAFDVVITPSYTEALGYVPLEAGLAGVARIASNVGGLPEIIENNVNGLLVKRNNEKELANAIEKLITNNELRTNLGKQAEIDLKHFTNLTEMRERIYEVYRG